MFQVSNMESLLEPLTPGLIRKSRTINVCKLKKFTFVKIVLTTLFGIQYYNIFISIFLKLKLTEAFVAEAYRYTYILCTLQIKWI